MNKDFNYTSFVEQLKDMVDHSTNPMFVQATNITKEESKEEK